MICWMTFEADCDVAVERETISIYGKFLDNPAVYLL